MGPSALTKLDKVSEPGKVSESSVTSALTKLDNVVGPHARKLVAASLDMPSLPRRLAATLASKDSTGDSKQQPYVVKVVRCCESQIYKLLECIPTEYDYHYDA